MYVRLLEELKITLSVGAGGGVTVMFSTSSLLKVLEDEVQ